MNCSNCGEEILEGAKFCIICGKTVTQIKKCINCGIELEKTETDNIPIINGKYFVYIGERISESNYKNLPNLYRNLIPFLQENPKYKLVLIGNKLDKYEEDLFKNSGIIDQIIVHNLYKSGVNMNNLNKYILWIKTNHESKIVNIYIKIKGSYMRDSNGFPVLNKRGTDIITLDKL